MTNKVAKSVILIFVLLQGFSFLFYSEAKGGTESHLLPWSLIGKEFGESREFCSKSESGKDSRHRESAEPDKIFDSGLSYIFQRGEAISVNLPSGEPTYNYPREILFNLGKWCADSWQSVGKVRAGIKSGQIMLSSGLESEGFFRLRFSVGAMDEQFLGFETYVVVCDNWKRDILAFCRSMKEDIEINADPELIFSSITVSHFDHAMEIVSRTSFLSGKILQALADAVQNKKKFDNGQCPELVVGKNKIRLKRFEGAGVAEFVVFVPKDYNDSKRWPLCVHVDPARWSVGHYGDYGEWDSDSRNHHEGMIDLWWHFPLPMEFEWKDYTYFLDILKSKLNLDEDRVYLYGYCANAISAMALALNYPDQWAELSAWSGNSFRHLAGNALNLPVVFGEGHPSESNVLLAYSNFAVKCFQYYGCRHFKYGNISKTPLAQIRGVPEPEAVRERNPQRVLYTIESLHNPAAYWAKILGREDENLTGTIDASVDGQTIFVKTKNVDAYSLDLVQAPINSTEPVEVIENGQSLDFVTGQIFTKKSKKYINATYVKNKRIRGPVLDVFTDPYLIVYGTGGKDKEFSKAIENVAKLLERKKQYLGEPESAKLTRFLRTASHCFCFADTNMPEKLIDSHNLILVGTPESNLWLSKISKELPVQISGGGLIAHGEHYIGRDLGFILIYPNPMNPEKYVLVFSGTSSRAIANIPKAYRQMKLIRASDVGIFEITEGADIRWYIMENFSSVWGWHDQWDQILALVNKKHPKWQWRQWIARAIRKQHDVDIALCEDPFRFSGLLPDRYITAEELEAEGVICEDPFRFSDLVSDGQITYRDLFNGFRNDWIVKIITDGGNLRELVGVPFDDISKRKVVKPTIDGLRFVELERDSKQTSLSVNELESDKKYTVALPYKLINGQRIGIVLKDYEIIGEGFLVPLLKDYLCKNGSLDLDSQLDSMRFNVF